MILLAVTAGALTWLGFSSSATAKTAFYLDNLEIRPE